MKAVSLVVPLAFVAGVALSLPSLAQQPAGSTGVCKDGSYTSAENKRGKASASISGAKWRTTCAFVIASRKNPPSAP